MTLTLVQVGSADNLFRDQSTFMVEMLETAQILKQATPRSFVSLIKTIFIFLFFYFFAPTLA